MRRIVLLVICVAIAGCASKKTPTTKPNLAAEKMKASLYGRLGGENAIRAVVDEFVARAASDDRVNFTRKGTGREWNASPENVEKLKVHLTKFLVGVTGGPADAYRGKDMRTVHQGMKITNSQFDAAAEDLKAAMDKVGVKEKERDELMAIVGGTRGEIVE